ncbi:unnamed protein product [Symbiodinium sp. CCMP2456]|nr:unnamed protein product [Symbiodinium sp. CCMP2456]
MRTQSLAQACSLSVLSGKLGEDPGSSSSSGGGVIEKIGNAVKSLFGGGEPKEPGPIVGSSALPGMGGLLGALIKPAFGMLGNLLKGSQEDMQKVMSEAQTLLTRSGRLGSRVECGPVYSQSYSSMNINGQQSTQVALQFQAQGDAGAGTVSCSATIVDGGVNFQDLRLDGAALDTSPGRDDNVIDV